MIFELASVEPDAGQVGQESISMPWRWFITSSTADAGNGKRLEDVGDTNSVLSLLHNCRGRAMGVDRGRGDRLRPRQAGMDARASRARSFDKLRTGFADAERVFAGPGITVEDDRRDYGEDRYLTYGRLGDRLVAIVWTPRTNCRHVISMRKANEREQRKYGSQLG
jgi:uncharacterized DUF497 family protein